LKTQPIDPSYLPFSREELVAAFAVTVDLECAERMVEFLLHPPDDEVPEGSVPVLADGTLLVLAALSNDLAHRVLKYRPLLNEEVRAIRSNPARWLSEIERVPCPFDDKEDGDP
jgi:hypothetical protein